MSFGILWNRHPTACPMHIEAVRTPPGRGPGCKPSARSGDKRPEAESLMARMRSLRRSVAGWMRDNKSSRMLIKLPSLWLSGGELTEAELRQHGEGEVWVTPELNEAELRRHGEGEAWVTPDQWRALAGLLGKDIAVLHQPADLVQVYTLTRPLQGGAVSQSWRDTLAPRLARQHAGTCEWHGRKLVVIHWNGSNHFSATRPM